MAVVHGASPSARIHHRHRRLILICIRGQRVELVARWQMIGLLRGLKPEAGGAATLGDWPSVIEAPVEAARAGALTYLFHRP